MDLKLTNLTESGMEIARKDVLEILQLIEEARAPGATRLSWEKGSKVVSKILKYLERDEAPAASSLLANLVNHITVTHPIGDGQTQLSMSRPFREAVSFLEGARTNKREGGLKSTVTAVHAVEKDGGIFFGSWVALEELREKLIAEHMTSKGCDEGCIKDKRIALRKSTCSEPVTQSGDRAKCNKCKETFYTGPAAVRPCVSAQYVLDRAHGSECVSDNPKS